MVPNWKKKGKRDELSSALAQIASRTGVILSASPVQVEQRISRVAHNEARTRFLAPLVKARGFGMTPALSRIIG